MRYPRILAELAGDHWAITAPALEGILAALQYELSDADYDKFHDVEPKEHEALASTLGTPVPDTRFSRVEGSVGSITVNGPIVPRASGIAEVSGLASIERLTAEFQALEQDPSISKILLVFDSPGGQVTGVSELASMIKASTKPTISYAYGMAASAAYWLASAADEFYAADTAHVGSIGVVATLSVNKDDSKVTITNSQSPYKHLDPSTDTGKANYTKMLDQLAEVFISAVSTNRNTDRRNVLDNFGQGALLGAEHAQSVGAIDGVRTLNTLMRNLKASNTANTMPMKVDTAYANDYIDTHICVSGEQPHEEKTDMPSLKDLVAEHPDLRAEVAAMEEAAHKKGAEAAATQHAEVLEAVKPVLESSEYPESFKQLAFGVLAGSEDPAVLRGALIAMDAIKAKAEADAAVADSEAVEPTAAVDPGKSAVSTDGILRSTADVDLELAQIKDEVK